MVQTFPTSLPVLTLQAGRKAPLRGSYLICQGTETQEPVLGLLQGGGEFTVAELQGLGRLSDLAQVTGAQAVQVVVQVGGGGRLLNITQGLAVTDRQTGCPRQAGARRSPRPRCRQARTHVCTGPPQRVSHPQPACWLRRVPWVPPPAISSRKPAAATLASVPPTLKRPSPLFWGCLSGTYPQASSRESPLPT